MKSKVLKNSIVSLLVIIECISVYLGYRSLQERNNFELPNVSMAPKKNKSSLAIMLNEGDGLYVESTNSEWPGSDYIYNAEKSGCLDANGLAIPGNPISYDTNTRKAQVSSNKTSYCYLYFDKK